MVDIRTGRLSRRTVVAGASALSAGLFAPAVLRAQDKFASKPIRIISAFPPGGLTDGFARAYGDYIGEKVGQPVIVEAKPGGGGATAAIAMKSAPADGHTLFITISSTILGNRILFKNYPIDPDKDFTLISAMPSGHLPMVVQADSGAKDLKEFGEYARKSEKISGGSFSAGSYAHMALDLMNKAYGTNFPVVQYRGEAPMWTDFSAGVLQVATGSYQGCLGVLQTGKGRAIAVPTKKRMKALPDVPTFIEQGFDQKLFQLVGYIAFLGPAGMPEDVAERLSQLCVEAGKTERVRKLLDTFGIDDPAMSRQDFKRIYDEEGPVWVAHAKALNLAPQ